MLSTNSNMVVAGVILMDNEYCPVYVHQTTGDCAYEEPSTTTAILISEVSVDDPLEIKDLQKLERSVASMGDSLIGIICKTDGTAVVIVDEDTAVVRPLSSLTEGGEPFSIDMSFDYEDDEDDDE